MNIDTLTDPQQIDELGNRLSKEGDHFGALECFQKASHIRALRRIRGYKSNPSPKPPATLHEPKKTAQNQSGAHSELCLHIVLTSLHRHQIYKLAKEYINSNPRPKGVDELFNELFYTVHKIANLPKIKILLNPVMESLKLVEDLLKKNTFSPPADYHQ